MNNKHALLSPSSSHRWLECTPSAYLESLEPYQPPSPYAAEGTEAHALAEIKLKFMLDKISVDQYDTEFANFRLNSKFYNAEFNDYVNDYVHEVMTIIKEDYKGQTLEVYLEDKVSFEHVVPNGSGTSDVVIIGKTFIHIIDLKFGKGVAVSSIGNPQLRLYALGVLNKYQLKGVFSEARMTIIQPRLYDKSTDYVQVTELNDWAINFVKPRAELAIAGKGTLCPGDHCKFCKRKGKCEALGQQQLAVAQREFESVVIEDNILEPHNMTPEMLSRIMYVAPKFIQWFNEVTSYVTKTMINEDLKIPGYKIVEGRSNRVITNPEAIVEKLRTSGFTEDDYLEKPKLLGITKLEKNVGKKLFNELCADYIVKPTGRPTVVPETDKRVALDVRQYRLTGQEFEDDENEENE